MSVSESDLQELLSPLCRLLVYCDPNTGRTWVCSASSLRISQYPWVYVDNIPGLKAKLTLPPSPPGSSLDGMGEQGVCFVEVDGHLGAMDENWCIGIVAKVEGCNEEMRRGFQGSRILSGDYAVNDQGDAELVALVAGLRMVRGLKPTATIIVVTDRTAEVRSLMNLQGKTRSKSSKGPRDSFIVLLRFLAFEIVHLLIHRNNGTMLFYHTSQVVNRLTRDGGGAWVADSLSRDRVGAPKTVVNFPPPDDLSDLLKFTDCIMVKTA